MSQLSQFSEGGFSDIISDVDNFIQEHGIMEDMGQLLGGVSSEIPTSMNEDPIEEYKHVPTEPYGTSDPPLPATYILKFPPEEPQNLSTDEYPGPLNFEVLIIPSEQKTPWEYSTKLNKIFIGINLKFPVAFSVEHRPDDINLFVRATPVFSQSQFFQEPVHRCVGHQHPTDPSNKGLPAKMYQHIMRCSNDDAQYFGDKNTKTRLSVVIPLGKPQTGSDVVKEFFYFVCKNSCPLGMNRRPIDIIFTLEDENGEVFGRKIVSVRVCSCPKRDREKEEKDVEKVNSQQGKKRKLGGGSGRRDEGSDDITVYPLTINIVGKNNYLHILAAGRDRMASEILKSEGRGSSDSPFRKSYNEWCNLLDKAGTE